MSENVEEGRGGKIWERKEVHERRGSEEGKYESMS